MSHKISFIILVMAISIHRGYCTKGSFQFESSQKPDTEIKKKDSLKTKKWNFRSEFGIGSVTGQFSQQYYKYLRTDDESYSFLGFQISRYVKVYERIIKRHAFILPVVTHCGTLDHKGRSQIGYRAETQSGYLFDGKTNRFVGTAALSLKYERTTWGIGFGAAVGNSLFTSDEYQGPVFRELYTDSTETHMCIIQYLPELRIGKKENFCVEIFRGRPLTLDYRMYNLGFSTGFGKLNCFSLKSGLIIYNNEGITGFYTDFRAPLAKNQFINFYGGFVPSVTHSESVSQGSDKYKDVESNSFYLGMQFIQCFD